jgi:hypothetical protein
MDEVQAQVPDTARDATRKARRARRAYFRRNPRDQRGWYQPARLSAVMS